MYAMQVKQCDEAGNILESAGETQVQLTKKQPGGYHVCMGVIY